VQNVSRVTRLNQLLLTSLGDIVRLRFGKEGATITLTGVDCSPDLKNAKVYYSSLDDNPATGRKFWKQNGYKIAKLMAADVILKRHPKLDFIYDDSLRNMAHVDQMLTEMEESGELPKNPKGKK